MIDLSDKAIKSALEKTFNKERAKKAKGFVKNIAKDIKKIDLSDNSIMAAVKDVFDKKSTKYEGDAMKKSSINNYIGENKDVIKRKNVKICPNCNKDFPEEAKFCYICGQPLPENEKKDDLDEITRVNEFLKRYGCDYMTQSQKSAIAATEGPVLMLAVPGSGKTTTMVMRVGYLVFEKGVKPKRILALTYNKKASIDMLARFEEIFGDDTGCEGCFKTIHAFCYKVYKYYCDKYAKVKTHTLLTGADINRIIFNIYKKVRSEQQFFQMVTSADVESAANFITKYKNLSGNYQGEIDEELLEVYNRYCEYTEENWLMDFDDQLIFAYDILSNNDALLTKYQDEFDYIFVDEAQDTSLVQHKIIELLARKKNNIFMVGDEDQTIYDFRGAYPEALLEFEKNYQGANILRIEENFRSDGYIVDKANNLIANNLKRYKKRIVATKKKQNDVTVVPSGIAEKKYVTEIIKSAKKTTVAIIARYNALLIPYVSSLYDSGVPFKIKELDDSFFTSRPVSFVKSIFALADNPNDYDAFKSCYYMLGLYLKKEQAEDICLRLSKNEGVSFCEIMLSDDAFKSKNNKILELEQELVAIKECGAMDAISRIWQYFDLNEYDMEFTILKELVPLQLKNYSRQDFLSTLNNLKRLIESVNAKSDNNANVTLTTAHGSKGLEFDTVFIIGASEGLFPSKRALQEGKLEEERRLFYVAMTRAKTELYILHENQQSRFITEMYKNESIRPKQSTQSSFATRNNDSSVGTVNTNGCYGSQILPKQITEQPKSQKEFDLQEGDPVWYKYQLIIGYRYKHKDFGEFVITELSDNYVSVKLDKGGLKTFSIETCLRLEKIIFISK